jgi:hypothetical protein
MSLIPSTAIGAAFTPVQRSTNDLIRARKVQSDKDYHHSQEVEELDDTAVSSVDDHTEQEEKRERDEENPRRKKRDQERVEIQSLPETRTLAQPAAKQEAALGLDISA